MGEEKVRKTNKDGKKNNQVILSSSISNGGGNGIAGLLVLGGALAIGGYVAVSSLHSFVTNRSNAKSKAKSAITKPEPKPQQLSLEDNIMSQHHDDDHEIETTPNNDGDTASACHVTSDMSISQALILEEKTDSDLNTSSEVVSPNCFHHHEIVLSNDSHPGSAASSSNENEIEEECSVTLFHNSGSQAQEDEPQQSLDSIQTGTKDDDDDYDNIVLESGEEEKEEDSSKATEETSLNSSEEEAEQDLKGEEGTNESDIQTEAAKTDISASADASLYAGTNMAMNVTPEATSNEKANISVGLNYQPSSSQSFQLITWLMPMLLQVLLLLIVLFTCTSLFMSFTK